MARIRKMKSSSFPEHSLQMTTRLSILLLAVALVVCGCASSPAASAESSVRARERQWLDAYEQRDAAAMSGILHDQFVITYPDGTRQTKDQVLEFIRTHPADSHSPRFHTEETTAHVSGETVVLTGIVITERAGSRSQQFYTDTWVYRDRSWRVLASQLATKP